MADDIRVNITADTSDLKSGMDSAVDAIAQLPSAANSASSAAGDFSDALQRIGEVAAAVFGAGLIQNALHGIAEEFKSITTAPFEWAEGIEHTSAMIGASVAKTQELAFAARATGTDFGRVTMLAGQLAREVAQLQSGGGSKGGVLAAAGLSIDDLRDVPTFINAAAEAMNRFGEDSVQVRTLLADIGGRMGLQFLPMIESWQRLSDTAREFGLVLDDQTVKAMADTEEKMNVLGAVIDVDKERLAAGLMPVIEVFIQLLTEAAESINVMAQTGALSSWAATFSDVLISLSESIITFARDVDHVAGGMESLFLRGRALVELGQGFIGEAAEDWKAAGAASGTSMMDAFSSSALAHLQDLREKIREQFSGIGEMQIVGGPDKKPTPLPDFTGGQAAQKSAEDAQRQHDQLLADTFKAFQQEQALEVAQAGGTATAKIAADERVVAEAKALFGESSSQYIESLTKQVDESNRAADATMQANERVARAYAENFRKQEADERQFYERQAREAAAAAKQTEQAWASVLGPIAQGFDQVVNSMLKGATSITAAFKKMGEQIALDLVHSGIKGLLEGGAPGSATAGIFGTQGQAGGGNIESILVNAFKQAGLSQVVQQLTGQSGLLTSVASYGEQAVGHLANVAATAVEQLLQLIIQVALAELHTVPVIGPFLEKGGIIPSAAGGMMTSAGGGGRIGILHASEMVLPKNIASRVISKFPMPGEEGGRSGGDTHVHFNINANDTRGFDALLKSRSGMLKKMVKDATRGK